MGGVLDLAADRALGLTPPPGRRIGCAFQNSGGRPPHSKTCRSAAAESLRGSVLQCSSLLERGHWTPSTASDLERLICSIATSRGDILTFWHQLH